MKVQLFVPPGGYSALRWSKGYSVPPLGLMYIAAFLEKEGYEVRIVPADILELSQKQIIKEIQGFEPDLIGVTATTETRFQGFNLIKCAKKAYPPALTILGGPHASLTAEECLTYISELDIVVRGEGEMTMLELCQCLENDRSPIPLFSVNGLSFRSEGKIISTPDRQPIYNLDSLPFPAFHLIPFERYNFLVDVPGCGKLPAINMITSRGCPYNCNFCSTPVNWGRTARTRSPQNVIEEIEYCISRFGTKVLYFFDDIFNVKPERVEQICDLFVDRKLNIHWKCDVRADLINKPLLIKMKKAGLFHLSFGLEAGSERVRNEVINKKVSMDSFHRLIHQCRELDVIPNPFFIFSHPTETWEEAQETLKIIEDYNDKIEASVAILHIYPGTPLEKTAKEKEILPQGFFWTKKSNSKIITLPAIQGNIPLFLDKLTWAQISELVFRWSFSGGKFPIIRKIPKIISSIRSLEDIKRYFVMAIVYVKLQFQRCIFAFGI